MKKIIAILLAILIFFSFSQLALRENFVKGDSQPIWPMFHYNAQHTGICPYDTSTTTSLRRWKFQTGNRIGSSPAIASDGTIYFGSWDHYLYAIKIDGTLKWKYQTGNIIYFSSPAIASDGTIYVGSYDDYLYAINPDGSLKWKFQTGDKIDSSPAIGSDGIIYIGSYDNYLYAINPNGTKKWKFQTGKAIESSSPAIGSDGTIYAGSFDDYLYAIKTDGSLKWKYQTEYVVDTSPSIGSDGIIYVGDKDYLYALNPKGSLRWKFQTGGSSSPAIGSDGTIYVGSADHYLYAININGSLKWKYLTGDYVISSPAIGSDGTIYVGSWDDYLYAIKSDGSLKWEYLTGDSVSSSPAIGSDGAIYFGSEDHYLYAIGEYKILPITNEKVIIKKAKVIILHIGNLEFTLNGESKTLDSPPIITNGRTLVPIRAIIEALSGTVGWNATAKKVTITLGKITIELWIGKNTAKVNGVDTPIDSTNAKVVPEIISGRTMLPLRFVTENLGATVVWDGTTQTITITY
jgi:outer membrane protein assembly factor BamB